MPQPISDAWFHRLKAATRDLVTACGGVVRAGELAHASKSEVSRWQTAADPAVVPIPAALALEAECGLPLVTTAMADLHGRRLTDGEDGGDCAGLFGRHAEAVRAAAEVISAGAAAQADGGLSAAEVEILDRTYGELERAVGGVRIALAARKGPRVVGGRA